MTRPPFTILIVDHEARNRRVVGAMLHRTGYKTRVAIDAEDAWSSIARNRPDLILLDVMMLGVDGYEVADRLKADPETALIPIILIGTQSHHDARPAGPPADAQGYLTRPFDRAELSLRVRSLIHHRASGGGSIAPR